MRSLGQVARNAAIPLISLCIPGHEAPLAKHPEPLEALRVPARNELPADPPRSGAKQENEFTASKGTPLIPDPTKLPKEQQKEAITSLVNGLGYLNEPIPELLDPSQKLDAKEISRIVEIRQLRSMQSQLWAAPPDSPRFANAMTELQGDTGKMILKRLTDTLKLTLGGADGDELSHYGGNYFTGKLNGSPVIVKLTADWRIESILVGESKTAVTFKEPLELRSYPDSSPRRAFRDGLLQKVLEAKLEVIVIGKIEEAWTPLTAKVNGEAKKLCFLQGKLYSIVDRDPKAVAAEAALDKEQSELETKVRAGMEKLRKSTAPGVEILFNQGELFSPDALPPAKRSPELARAMEGLEKDLKALDLFYEKRGGTLLQAVENRSFIKPLNGEEIPKEIFSCFGNTCVVSSNKTGAFESLVISGRGPSVNLKSGELATLLEKPIPPQYRLAFMAAHPDVTKAVIEIANDPKASVAARSNAISLVGALKESMGRSNEPYRNSFRDIGETAKVLGDAIRQDPKFWGGSSLLGSLGPESRPTVVTLLRDKSAEVRRIGFSVLDRYPVDGDGDLLKVCASDADPRIRAGALLKLCASTGKLSHDELLGALRELPKGAFDRPYSIFDQIKNQPFDKLGDLYREAARICPSDRADICEALMQRSEPEAWRLAVEISKTKAAGRESQVVVEGLKKILIEGKVTGDRLVEAMVLAQGLRFEFRSLAKDASNVASSINSDRFQPILETAVNVARSKNPAEYAKAIETLEARAKLTPWSGWAQDFAVAQRADAAGIRSFSRFTNDQLETLIEMKSRAPKDGERYTVIVAARDDTNGALRGVSDLVKSALDAKEYVRYEEVDSVPAFVKALEESEVHPSGKKRPPDFLLVVAHGSTESMTFGNESGKEGDEASLTVEGIQKLADKKFKIPLAKDALVGVISCGTGEGKGKASNIGTAFRLIAPDAKEKGILSPDGDTNIPLIIRDDAGKPIDILFRRSGKLVETHQSRRLVEEDEKVGSRTAITA